MNKLLGQSLQAAQEAARDGVKNVDDELVNLTEEHGELKRLAQENKLPDDADAQADARDRRQDDHRELDLPAKPGGRHRHAKQSADHQATRPPGVKRVEFSCFFFGIERRDQRVHDRLYQSPADAGHQRADPDDVVDAGAWKRVASDPANIIVSAPAAKQTPAIGKSSPMPM